MQVKLLRVLQERRVRPLGGSTDISIDVRLIASTNRDLKRMVAGGQFREDFYYRISVIPIHVPPLRERVDDIGPLARNFLRKFGLQMGKGVLDFDRDILDVFERYPWPGNIRELENAVEYAVAVCGEHDGRVCLEHLPQSVTGITLSGEATVQIPPEGLDFETRLSQIEKQYLLAALRAAQGVRTHAAELLHMSYRSFRHYAKKYNI
jgi:two-component system response regulator PilR (NtrC family)